MAIYTSGYNISQIDAAIGKANTAYQKPSGGIPSTDLASGVIPTTLPANGGNAATVGGHTVGTNVPSGAVFTDTTYSVMGASGSGHASGLVPDTPTTAGTSKYLREDGTWVDPLSGTSYSEKMAIQTTTSTSLSAALNTFYRFTSDVENLAITLPTVSDATRVQNIIFGFTTGSTPNVTISAPSGVTVSYFADYAIEANKSYELNCLFDGVKWIVAYGVLS